MRSRRDRIRATRLSVLPLEDRSVPHGSPLDGMLTLPPQFYLTGPNAEFLTGPQPGDYQALALKALGDNAAALGLTAADAADPISESAYADGGAAHVYYRQKYNGLPVIGGKIGVHLTAAGEVITVNGGFVPGLGASNTGVPGTPTLTWTEAVSAAARAYGLTPTAPPAVESSTGGLDRAAVLTAPGVSVEPVPVNLAYVTTPTGVKLGWQMRLDVPDGEGYFVAAVDAATGDLLYSVNLAADLAAYKVQALPDESPLDGPGGPRSDSRQLLVNPADPVASPFGWHDTNGVAGAEFTDTRGNNVFAQEDRDDNDAGGRRPNGGAGLFFDNPINFNQDPDTYVDALVANLFYLNNALHDIHYHYGFTEAAGNFQQRNYTGQGRGGDAVQADALDGSGTDNANFYTPVDGVAPRMQMYRFTYTNPNRSSDIDNGIIIHEYGHGVSNRLTGGPMDDVALQSVQSRGMGEGWSDWHALMLLQRPSDGKNDAVGIGNYALGYPANGPGIRRNPYSFSLTTNPITFDDYNLDRSFFGSPQVHNTGEIWSSSLWDLNWLLTEKYGFDQDLYTGYTAGTNPGNGPGGAGNKLAMRLVMDGMKLQPANPSFIDARDAILSADRALTGGLNQREIWTAFARRRLGFSAASTDSTRITITTASDLPAAAANPGVIGQTPRGVTTSAPSSVTVNFSEAMDTDSFAVAQDVQTFTGPGGVDLKAAITGFSWAVDKKSLTINFTPPGQPQGRYALRLGPDILDGTGGTGNKLDQNLNGTAGEAADAYTAHFGYDGTPLTVAQTPATLSAGEDSLFVTFAEPVAAASLGVTDIQLTQGTVTAFVQTAPNQVRYDVTGLTTGVAYYTVKYGAVTDVYGFANTAKNGSISVIPAGPEIDTVPLPGLARLNPVGWQAFQGGLTTWAAAPTDTDTFTFSLDAGARVQAVVDQAPTLQAKVTLVGPLETELAAVTAAAPGGAAATAAVDARVSGAYRVKVEAQNGTTGAYRLRLLIAGAAEAEGLGGAANNAPAAAESLNGRFNGYGGGASGLTLQGAVGPGDTADVFGVALQANETLAVGLSRAASGTTTVQILDPAGNVVSTPDAVDPGQFTQAVSASAVGGAGTYTVRVSTPGVLSAETYLLGVVKNGTLDREPNDARSPSLPLTPLPAAVRGGLDAVGAEDNYRVVPTTSGFLTVWTETPGGGPAAPRNGLGPILEVYATPTTLLARSDLNTAGDGKNEFLRVPVTAGATYYVRVTGQTTAGATGDYLLKATTTADPGPIAVQPGGPYTVTEGQTLNLVGAAVDPFDPVGRSLQYEWYLDETSSTPFATGATPTVTWAALELAGVRDGLPAGTRTSGNLFPIFLRVRDGGGTVVGSTGVVLAVVNAPPTGTATPGGQVGESSPIIVGFATAADPASADNAAGLRYSFDFDNDGIWDEGDGSYGGSKTTSTVAVPAAFVADGSGAGNPYAVKVRVVDKDNGATDQTITFSVVNTPPVATFTAPAAPFLENQGGRSLTIGSIADSKADKDAGFRYSIDFDGNGTWDVGDGTEAGSVAGSAAAPNGVLAIPAQYFAEALPPDAGGNPQTLLRVRALIFDKDGGQASFGRDVGVVNAAPTATLSNSAAATGGVDEGNTTATVSLGGAADASPVDTTAGLRYSFDFNGDGLYVPADGDIGDGTYAGSAGVAATQPVPAARLADGSPAGVTVRARVIDKDGGSTEYTTAIPVRNVAPTAAPSVAAVGGGPVAIGSKLAVTFAGPADPSPTDTARGFKFYIDVNNDGDFDDTELGENPTPAFDTSANPVVEFPGYDTPGPAVIRARIEDKDGGFTDTTLPVSVANVAPGVVVAPVAPVAEGGAATVRVTATSPSGVTTAAGFRFAYDFNGDGTFDLGTGKSYAGGVKTDAVAIPAALLTDGGATRNVTVRVYEVNGLFTDQTLPVQVLNVAPTAKLVPPAGRVEVRTPATFTVTNPADPSPQDTAAGFKYSFDFNNDGDSSDAGEVTDSPTPAATTQFPLTGPYTVRVRVTDKDGGATDYFTTVTVGTLTKTFYAAGVGADNGPGARLYDGAGNLVFAGQVFGADATGGVRVSTADVTGDGVPDLVAATGPGVPAEVAVVDGKTQAVVFRVRPFGTFAGGAFVATGDTDGDGKADIAVSPDEGGGPRVVLYSGAGFRQTASFFGIADANFRGGARVAMADVNGDGLSDLLVAAGFGGGPRVAGYDGKFLTTSRQKLFNDFFAFDVNLRNGVFLSGGDLNGDGRAEVVLGAGPGGGPQVLAIDGASLLQGQVVERANFFANDINNRNGVRVTVADIDADGRADIVTGDASGPGLNVFRGRSIQASGRPADEFELLPFSALMNGVFVG